MKKYTSPTGDIVLIDPSEIRAGYTLGTYAYLYMGPNYYMVNINMGTDEEARKFLLKFESENEKPNPNRVPEPKPAEKPKDKS